MTISRLTLLPGSADNLTGRKLLAAMEVELDDLYADRGGSLSSVPATPALMRPPHGAFLVVYETGRAVGCGGLKRLDEHAAEIKRMYLVPAARGRGLSRPLLEALESAARALGYTQVRLDTGNRQPAAEHLFRSAGYREVADYNSNPLASFWFEKSL